MGGTSSTFAELPKNDQLNRLVSTEVLTPSDPFWNSLLSYTLQQPVSRTDWRELGHYTEELLKRFLLSNLKTGNFVSLLRVILLRTSELKNSVLTENSLFIWQTHNALFIVRVVARFMMERIKDEDVVRQFEVSVLGEEEDPEAMFPLFLRRLVELVVETPPAAPTYPLLTEATRLTLVLLAGPLYSPPGRPTHQLAAWREVMAGPAAVMAVPLTCSLLLRFMEQQVAPARAQGSGSLVLGLASGVWSLLTLGYGGGQEEEQEGGTNTPLADTSLTLLLLLVNHCTDTTGLANPYCEALASFSNSCERASEPPASALFQLEVPALYTALAGSLHTDEATLLLYLLLHRNKGFHSFVLASTDIDRLVIPILRTLYRAPDCSNHHIYMSLIILLILSEDDLFNQAVHSCILRPSQVAWYTERAVTDLSLGGLLTLVVIRTIQYNMLKMRDKYLHTNCLAALANMSCQFRGLHPYVAQRIVSLFETLARKHGRLVEGLQGVEEDGGEEEGFTEVSEAVQDTAVLEEVLRMVLEIVNSCLVHQTQHNPNLIYALLYKRELFETAGQNPAFADLTANLLTVVVHMGSRLEQVQERKGRGLTVEEVQEVVRHGAAQFPRDRLNRLPDLKFKYVEEEEPEDFFIPYVWTLATQRMYFAPENMRLLPA